MQRAFKGWLMDGRKTGSGVGVLLFDGEKILNQPNFAEMDPKLFDLFAPSPDSLDLYLSLEEKLQEAVPGVEFRVQKTQVSFYLGHMFGCASLLPVVPKARRPQPYLTVTFGLREPWTIPGFPGGWSPAPAGGPTTWWWGRPRSWTGSCLLGCGRRRKK